MAAQECGTKGGPHDNISAWKRNITAWIQNKALFLHGEITNLPLIIQCIDFVPFLLINGTWKRINIAFGPIQIVSRAWLGNASQGQRDPLKSMRLYNVKVISTDIFGTKRATGDPRVSKRPYFRGLFRFPKKNWIFELWISGFLDFFIFLDFWPYLWN